MERFLLVRRGHDSRQEGGQVLVIGLFVLLGLTMLALSVANIGMMVAEKIRLQDTVDASAYSAATVQARYMNLSAYINRAMVANYNSMAFNTAVWSTTDSLDHGLAPLTAALYQLSTVLTLFVVTAEFAPAVDTIADGLRAVHSPIHDFNHQLDDKFAQDNKDWNKYIESYNVDILTVVQGFLYAAMQSSRREVAAKVAQRIDPEVKIKTTLGVVAETINHDELERAVDYVIRDPDARTGSFSSLISSLSHSFDKMGGEPKKDPATGESDEDTPLYLAAVTEASLDKFAAGRKRDGEQDTLRNFGIDDLLGPVADAIEVAVGAACYATTLPWDWGTCDADVTVDIGLSLRDGFENSADESHVPFIARQRMREVTAWGVFAKFDGVPDSGGLLSSLMNSLGHTSSDAKGDVGNCANITFSFGEGIDLARAFQSLLLGCKPGAPVPSGGLNSINMLQSSLMFPMSPTVPPLVIDDHWDGSFDEPKPVDTWELPLYGGTMGIPATAQYIAKVIEDGTEDGVPRYDWRIDLDNVGFPNYVYPEEGSTLRLGSSDAENDRLTGPSVIVAGVKEASEVNSLRVLGIGNDYSLTALARAQVYYTRSQNRPEERPSLFNPHWAARLAPLESEDTPVLARKGLPYLTSMGLPFESKR